MFTGICLQSVDCKFIWEMLTHWDPVWPHSHCPVFLHGEVWHHILQASFVKGCAAADEFRTCSVPTGVHVVLAGDAVVFAFVTAFTHAMHIFTGITCVLLCYAVHCEVPPLPTFHALDRLMFLFGWSGLSTAYEYAISD